MNYKSFLVVLILLVILLFIFYYKKNDKFKDMDINKNIIVTENFEISEDVSDYYHIWMYWENIPNKHKPKYLDLCYQTVIKNNQHNFKIHLLDENNYQFYLPNLRKDLDERLSIPQKVDYIRYNLLYYYGGIWLDADTIVINNLSPLIEKLKYYEYVGFGCHFSNSSKCKNGGYPYPANWVMVSRKNGLLMKSCIEQCDIYLDNGIDLKINYHALGRENIWKQIQYLLKYQPDWKYYHYNSICLERDEKNDKFTNKRMISKENISDKCRDKFLFIPIYNTAPGFPSWFNNMSENEILKSDMLISKLFREGLKLNNNKDKNNKIHRYYDRCYVINLSETKEGIRRWKVIQQHPYLKDKVIRFPATYGKERNKQLYDNKIVNTNWDYGRWLSPKYTKVIDMTDGELGVSISHYRLWKMIAEQNEFDSVLILEDDAIQISTDIEKRLDDIFKEVPNNWDIILLGFWLHKGDTGYKVSDNIYRVKDFVLMHSYIINKKGAKKLLQNLPIDAPLDTWMSLISDKLFIYRHNFIKNQSSRPSSRLIVQERLEKQIVNTNNFINI